MIQLQSLEDVKSVFPDDITARNYLMKLRWGKCPQCPYCGNDRAYIIDKGLRYKCANNKCYKRFTVTVKTLLEGSNVPLHVWIYASFMYVEKNGEINIWDLERGLKIGRATASLIKHKLDYAWPYVFKEVALKEMTDDILKSMFNLYDKKNECRSEYLLDHFDDISDIKQYKKLILYTKYWLRRCHWIVPTSLDVEEIIAETFIYMNENKIKEYNAELVSFLIRKITSRLWYKWMYAHPNTLQWFRNRQKEWYRNATKILMPCYLNGKTKRANPNMLASEIAADKNLREERRVKILEFRKKHKTLGLEDFHSHFN